LWLVCQTDRRCLRLQGGFRVWPIQWNHAKCCGTNPCCHSNKIWAKIYKSACMADRPQIFAPTRGFSGPQPLCPCVLALLNQCAAAFVYIVCYGAVRSAIPATAGLLVLFLLCHEIMIDESHSYYLQE